MATNIPQGGSPPPPPSNWGAAPPPPQWGQAAGDTQARHGGFWLRFVAYLIDAVILNIVILPVGLMLGVFDTSAGLNPGFNIIAVIAGWLYEALMVSSTSQATLGKMAVGLKVTRADGSRLSFARATGRFFGKIISFIILLIGFIMIAFTARKQGLHDMMADTLVVRAR
jgi:uncharacterized RDD family membrane protein YckC